MIEEIKCDECNGEGFYFEMGTDLYGNSKSQLRSCKKCKHTGKVNWIENVFAGLSLQVRFHNRKTRI